MKKYQIVLVSIASLLVVLFVVSRATNAFQYYTITAGSNEPTLKQGSYVFTSNLITPKRFDFIAFRTVTAEFGKQVWTHRVCGMPGDTVVIRDGDLFVNGRAVDETMNLKKMYVIPNALLEASGAGGLEAIFYNEDSMMVTLETLKQQAIIRKARRLQHMEEEEPEVVNRFGHKWTRTRFGPYVVPANSYFVMGDNRYLSMDSRLIGPIAAADVLGTTIQ